MSVFSLPLFGELVPDEHYEVTVEIHNRDIPVSLDLKFVMDFAEVMPVLTALQYFLPDLEVHAERAHQAILDGFNEDSEWAKAYVRHHLRELSTEQLTAIIGENPSDASSEQLAKSLRLREIWAMPFGLEDSELANFEFTVGEEYTNYALRVVFALDGTISEIVMES